MTVLSNSDFTVCYHVCFFQIGLSFNMLNEFIYYCLIFKHSSPMARLITINWHVVGKTVCILINWLLQKPADQDPHCFQKSIYLVFQGFQKNLYLVCTVFKRIYIWFCTVFTRVYIWFCTVFKRVFYLILHCFQKSIYLVLHCFQKSIYLVLHCFQKSIYLVLH